MLPWLAGQGRSRKTAGRRDSDPVRYRSICVAAVLAMLWTVLRHASIRRAADAFKIPVAGYSRSQHSRRAPAASGLLGGPGSIASPWSRSFPAGSRLYILSGLLLGSDCACRFDGPAPRRARSIVRECAKRPTTSELAWCSSSRGSRSSRFGSTTLPRDQRALAATIGVRGLQRGSHWCACVLGLQRFAALAAIVIRGCARARLVQPLVNVRLLAGPVSSR